MRLVYAPGLGSGAPSWPRHNPDGSLQRIAVPSLESPASARTEGIFLLLVVAKESFKGDKNGHGVVPVVVGSIMLSSLLVFCP